MDNFLITGHGRCGTKLLSSIMSHSKLWNIYHEPRGASDDPVLNSDIEINSIENLKLIKVPNKIENVFHRKYYGEVNSVLKYYFLNLKAEAKGIIYRNYKGVILSFANRRNEKEIFDKINNINLFDKIFYEILLKNEEIKLIDFKEMTTSIKYLYQILYEFGIIDVQIDPSILSTKINKDKNTKYNDYEDLPLEVKNYIETLDWKEYKLLDNWI
ncbi:MAG: hypothetical protein ACTSUG_12975 [Candidatus Helarchaeota archaeon]